MSVVRNPADGVGHYCLGMNGALTPLIPILTINVSAIRSPGITGTPVAYQTTQDANCGPGHVAIVTDVITAGAVTPSDDVWFALSAN